MSVIRKGLKRARVSRAEPEGHIYLTLAPGSFRELYGPPDSVSYLLGGISRAWGRGVHPNPIAKPPAGSATGKPRVSLVPS